MLEVFLTAKTELPGWWGPSAAGDCYSHASGAQPPHWHFLCVGWELWLQCCPTAVPSQDRVTQQILSHWQSFQDVKLMFSGSYRVEQLSLRSHQRVVDTVEESVLQMEMSGLESQEEDAPNRILFFKPMSWLGQIRPHRRDESWSSSLWQTFFSTSMGAQIPAIAEKSLTTYLCRKFQLDPLGDHLNTSTSHSGDKKHTTGWLTKATHELFENVFLIKWGFRIYGNIGVD